jgi:uncharacterized membrane protein YbaN (DUF454 family)
MKTRAKRILLLIAGWSFVLLGVAGLFLPILQGVLFLLIGLFILSSEYVWAHHLLRKIRARFPGVSRKADEAAEKAAHWLRRLSRQREPD